jgi:ribose-phosphate pyrophosphokinase
MKLLAGNSNRPLAEAIAAFLGMPLTNATVQRFADMEIFVEIHENVRGEDVFLASAPTPLLRRLRETRSLTQS